MQFTVERGGFTHAHTFPPHVTQLVFSALNNRAGFEHCKFHLTLSHFGSLCHVLEMRDLLLVVLLLCTKKAMYSVICILHAGSASPVLPVI